MVKQKVKFLDFNGEKKEAELYFNLNEAEYIRFEAELISGTGFSSLEDFIENMKPETNPAPVVEMFELLLSMSYGEKSEDGLYFNKSKENRLQFLNSAAYSAFLMELLQDADKASVFFNQVAGANAIPRAQPNPKKAIRTQ